MSETQQTIFVVDDDDAIRDALRMLLDSIDLNHAMFASASEFLASHDMGHWGCLILDIH